MQTVWGSNNVCLYTLPSGVGVGPGVWCHGLLPDYHAFRGSYGGYAFPLHDRRPDIDAPNVSPALLAGLSAAYGEAVAAEDAFDAILCLLSARSYTTRFAEDLEDVFPHVPFPSGPATFREAVRLGGAIRALETFAAAPPDPGPDFVHLATEPDPVDAPLAAGGWDAGALSLCANGTGRVTGIPAHVWTFEVSGYPVLQRWLQGREGLPVDLALFEAFRDICGRIAALVDLFTQADQVLEDTLSATLTRDALGLHPGG